MWLTRYEGSPACSTSSEVGPPARDSAWVRIPCGPDGGCHMQRNGGTPPHSRTGGIPYGPGYPETCLMRDMPPRHSALPGGAATASWGLGRWRRGSSHARSGGDEPKLRERRAHMMRELELLRVLDPPLERALEDGDARFGDEVGHGLLDAAPPEALRHRRGE